MYIRKHSFISLILYIYWNANYFAVKTILYALYTYTKCRKLKIAPYTILNLTTFHTRLRQCTRFIYYYFTMLYKYIKIITVLMKGVTISPA